MFNATGERGRGAGGVSTEPVGRTPRDSNTNSPDTSQITDTSPKQTLGTVSRTGEKNIIQRNLSTCRLKKAVNISDLYDVSTQVLGTGLWLNIKYWNFSMTRPDWSMLAVGEKFFFFETLLTTYLLACTTILYCC